MKRLTPKQKVLKKWRRGASRAELKKINNLNKRIVFFHKKAHEL